MTLFTSYNSFTLNTMQPIMAGSLDPTGLVGVTVKNRTTPATMNITAANFYPEHNRIELITTDTINVDDSYSFEYDSTAGDWRLWEGVTKTEMLGSPSFGTACGADWDCTAGADSVTGLLNSSAAYFTQVISAASLNSRKFEVTMTVNAGSNSSGIGYIDSADWSVQAGETLSLIYTAGGTSNVTAYPSAAGPSSTDWDFFSMLELNDIEGDKVETIVPQALTNYLQIPDPHVLHFPCDERSGNSYTDKSGMTVIPSDDGGSPLVLTYPLPYAISVYDKQGTSVLTKNIIEGYASGVLIHYISCDLISENIDAVNGSGKASLTHIYPFSNTVIDIQCNPTDTSDNTVVTLSTYNRATDSVQTVTQTLSQDLKKFNQGTVNGMLVGQVALAVVVEFGTNTQAIYVTDGTTPYNEALASIRTINEYDLSDTIPIAGSDETVGHIPIIRGGNFYTRGAYCFQDFKPTQLEIETFINDLYTKSRAGDKSVYAPWSSER